MCRINGWIDKSKKLTEEDGLRMRDAMQHGGPDGAGYYISSNEEIHFGHRRLSLIDLTDASSQPMVDDQEKIALVFNGEIYNFKELRAELHELGHHFHTTGDTEVILEAYKEWGTDAFGRLNGMFAIAIHDERKHLLILARDHAGIKPLYYHIGRDRLLFASEIRAFKALNPKWEENPDWKKYFLLFGFIPEPVTTLQNVQPLAKGTYLTVHTETLATEQQCFNRFYFNYTIYSEEEARSLIQKELEESVQRHLISDAPIGLFLSGGIDSSLLTLLAKPHVGDHLQTLSIVFENDKFSEKQYQDIIIDKTGAKHHSFLVKEQDFKDSIEDIIAAMDQPSNDGINSYFICKYAKEYGLKAVLSGLGADELFGGYHSFNRTKPVSMLRHLPDFMLSVAGILKDDKKKKISFLQIPGGLGEYLFNRGFFIPSQVARLLDCTEKEVEDLVQMIALPLFTNKLSSKERVSFVEVNLYMQNQLLKDTDYMSMWHAVEVRVPFLDKKLMNLIYNIHPDIRYNPNLNKHLLIKAFDQHLPEQIWNRPKQGFVFPFELWMQHLRTPPPVTKTFNSLYKGLQEGTIHWSRYWCYLLLNQERIQYVES